jgi:hypothetical protein
VCPKFRLTKQDNYFETILPTYEANVIFEAARVLVDIGLRLKLNYHSELKLT